MNSKIFILKISDIIELGCRFLVQYICREMLINAYEVFCPSVPVCSKIVDGGARRRRRAVCAVPFSNTIMLEYDGRQREPGIKKSSFFNQPFNSNDV